MEIQYRNIVLRNMIACDIEDEIRWMNEETSWIVADTPWSIPDPVNPDELRMEMEDIIAHTPETGFISRLEIVASGKHIGFVCAYPLSTCDMEPSQNRKPEIAVGIEICEPSFWSKGFGTNALSAWIAYCKESGIPRLFLETWSGNTRMIRCATKLGFKEFKRVYKYHYVDGEQFDALTYVI